LKLKGKNILLIKEMMKQMNMFIERIFYISNMNPLTKKDFDKTLMESNIIVNTKYLGCKYNVDILTKIDKIKY
jgi:hypothetical protein